MTEKLKIYVNTAYSGEEGFEASVESIFNQKGVEIHHNIVRDLPILDAFNVMYQTWEKEKEGFDYVVQVDPDMRFVNEDSLITLLKRCPEQYNHFIFPVFDWPSQKNIWGFNIYKPDLNWPILVNKYGPDKEQRSNPNHRFWTSRISEKAHVMHAETFNMRQAFRLGWHRHIRGHPQYLSDIERVNRSSEHTYRRWILDGAEAAKMCIRQDRNNKVQIEYTADLFIEEFKKYERMQNE